MPKGGGSASEAGRIATGLMTESSKIGLPAVRAVTDYASKGLDQGLPGYANKAYTSAGTSALEQALAGSQAARRGISQTASGSGSYIPALTGASGDLAREAAGINLSKANATLSQRNQLLKTMIGSGAQSVNLASSFGGLANRGMAAGLGRGDPTYEAVVGGGSAASALLMHFLTADTSTGIAGFNSGGALGYDPKYNSQLNAYQGGGGTVNMTTRP